MAQKSDSEFGPAGQAFWDEWASQFHMTASEESIVKAGAECADLVQTLDAIIKERGPLNANGNVANYCQEVRFQKNLLLKITAQIRAWTPDTGSKSNLGARGVYAVGSR